MTGPRNGSMTGSMTASQSLAMKSAQAKNMASRYKRILFGGTDPQPQADEDEEIWTLEDSYNAVGSDLRRRLAERRTGHLTAVQTFLPRILQRPDIMVKKSIVMHHCDGCVVFSDASGFTKLTETLAQKADGAEVLSKCLNKFFTPLIDIIESYRGDVIKFSGDALSILFEATDDYSLCSAPCGSPDAPRKTPFQLACLRGAACCLEIHKRLHNFDTGEGGVRLTLHIGVGAGRITILQVGGEFNRFEYVIAGTPMEQIAIAEPLAGSGETVLSPFAWNEISHMLVEGEPLDGAPEGYHRMVGLETSLHTYPTVKQAALECTRAEDLRRAVLQESLLLDVSARFIPRGVLKHLKSGNSSSINEMRSVTIIFVQIGGVDVSTEYGSKVAQQLMTGMQRACYGSEGNLNKFLVDDKGLLFLFVFGLPPLMHIDDPTRAIVACFDMAAALKSMGLVGRFGVTTGRVFCGIVGSDRRREYTVMGDTVNLSARLMAKASENSVLIDEATYQRSCQDVVCKKIEPFMVKGKANLIQAYEPLPPQAHTLEVPQLSVVLNQRTWNKGYTELSLRVKDEHGERHELKVRMPWHGQSKAFGGSSPLLQMKRWRQLQAIQAMLAEENSLLKFGGSLSISGQSGTGKTELCEYIISEASNLRLVPVFAFMRARSAERWRAAAELIQTCICMLLGSKATDKVVRGEMAEELLGRLVGTDKALHKVLTFFGFENFEVPDEHRDSTFGLSELRVEVGVATICERLILELAKTQGVLVVLRVRRGTDLLDGLRDQGTAFWALASRLSELSIRRQAEVKKKYGQPDCPRPIVVVVVSREKPRAKLRGGNKLASFESLDESQEQSAALAQSVGAPCVTGSADVRSAAEVLRGPSFRIGGGGLQDAQREIVTTALTEDAAVEMMCHCLGLATTHGGSLVKRKLREFVSAVSINVPTYIQECVRHLILEKAVGVRNGECAILAKDLSADVNIAEWVQTSMVGGTIAKLESLKSAQNHIMKLATVFEGPFSPLDLAAANRVLFGWLPRFLAFHDQAKLLSGCQALVAQGFLTPVVCSAPADRAPVRLPRWTISNTLFRKVAGAMVLNSQRILIKRAAIIERALNVKIPKRISLGQKGVRATADKDDAAGRSKLLRHAWNSEAVPFEPKAGDDGQQGLGILIAACALGNVQMAAEILKSGNVDVNKPSEVGLLSSAAGGRRACPEAGGYTPLHYAASGGEVEIVHLLCEHGAQVAAKSQRGETPVLVAAQRGHLEIVQYLCEAHGALSAASQDDLDFWERALPELSTTEDMVHPLSPAFPQPPPVDPEVSAARRQRVLEWMLERLHGPEQQTIVEVGAGVGDLGPGQELQSRSRARRVSAHRLNLPPGGIQPAGVSPTKPPGEEHRKRASGTSQSSSNSNETPSRYPRKVDRHSARAVSSLLDVRAYIPASFRNAAIRTRIRVFLTRGRASLVVMLIALIVALFLPDLWVIMGVPSSTGADVILTLVMLAFLSELILLSLVDSSYPLSFFFFMDCIGTVSMIGDISYLLGGSASKEDANVAGKDDLTLFRATRTAKVGARAGRLSRLVKVMRFLPGIGVSKKDQQEGEKLQQIQNQLTNVLSKRVACLTIILVIVMPLCTIGSYPEGDFSKQVWVEALRRRAEDVSSLYRLGECNGRNPLAGSSCDVAMKAYYRTRTEMAEFYFGRDYGPFEICVDTTLQPLEGCWSATALSGFSAPERRSFHTLVRAGGLVAKYDYGEPSRAEARIGLVLIVLVIVLMCGACTLLNYSASELAVRPLERMLTSIKNSAKAIFSSVNAMGAKVDDDDDFGEEMGSEVALLERVVRKIATLAELSSKKNPFDDLTMFGMKNEELGVLALTAGVGAVRMPTGLTSQDDSTGGQGAKRTEISVTMQWQLEEMGVDYQVLSSWNFNVLELSRTTMEQLGGWLLMNNPGSSNWTENQVDGRTMRSFVTKVAAGYQENPYHSFAHALDVSHCVFRYMLLMQAESVFSMLDQFALLVASVGHDIGHFGLSNSFLTEVQHELAVRYNDRSPLENMHCSKLFEILAEHQYNIFQNAEPQQYKDVRKTIIDAILHTDITQHPAMVKDLELLYEMNSKVFGRRLIIDRSAVTLSDPEVEILSTAENKKLVLQMLLHGADISNPTKPWQIAHEWAYKILDEYATQGDQEKKLGIPVQVLNDREKVNRPNSQIGFIEFIITPFVIAEVRLFPMFYEVAELLETNLNLWERTWIEESVPSEAEREKVKERIEKLNTALQACSRTKDHTTPKQRRRSIVGIG